MTAPLDVRIKGASKSILGLLLGKRLGEGCFRAVFEYALDPTLVVKVQYDNHQEGQRGLTYGHMSFANIVEWHTWCRLKDTGLAKHFAPCHHISADGKVLIQARTEPIRKFRKDDVLADFFADVKPDNFGRLNGKLVCHDYALHGLTKLGIHEALRKPKK